MMDDASSRRGRSSAQLILLCFLALGLDEAGLSRTLEAVAVAIDPLPTLDQLGFVRPSRIESAIRIWHYGTGDGGQPK